MKKGRNWRGPCIKTCSITTWTDICIFWLPSPLDFCFSSRFVSFSSSFSLQCCKDPPPPPQSGELAKVLGGENYVKSCHISVCHGFWPKVKPTEFLDLFFTCSNEKVGPHPWPLAESTQKLCWEKESIHRPAPVRNFSLPKKMGPQRKDFGGRYGFPGFIGFLHLPPAWKVFLRGQQSSLKDFLSVVVVCAFFFSVLVLSQTGSSFHPQLQVKENHCRGNCILRAADFFSKTWLRAPSKPRFPSTVSLAFSCQKLLERNSANTLGPVCRS